MRITSKVLRYVFLTFRNIMAPLFSERIRRRDSLVEVADWWGKVFSPGRGGGGPGRKSSSEVSPLLGNSDNSKGEAMGDGDEEDQEVHSSRDIFAAPVERSPSSSKWRQRLLLPLRVLFPAKILVYFFLANIIPALSMLIPLFFTGNLPDQSSLALAGQFTFVQIVLEVIQEGIGNSLFHFVGKNYKDKRDEALGALKLSIVLLFAAGIILAAVTLLFTKEFVSFINTPPDIVEKTKIFLWISSFSFPMILLNYAITNFLFITTSRHIITAQVIQLIGTFGFNFLFFNQGNYSLHWGVDELGTYKVIQQGFNLIVNLIFLHVIEKLSLKKFWWNISIRKNFFTNFSELFSVSWPNFGDSGVRNLFYFMVTLKFTNELGSTSAGAWNLLNTIIYGIFLIPSNSISNYVKVLIGHEAEGSTTALKKVIRKTSKDAFVSLTSWTVILMIFGYTFWPYLAAFFNESNVAVQELSAIMFNHLGWSFVLLSYNNVLDSLFYGTGETIYVFYQSLGTDLSVYLVPWILYEFGVIVPSYWLVFGLFMAAMVVDFALTSLFCLHLWIKLPN